MKMKPSRYILSALSVSWTFASILRVDRDIEKQPTVTPFAKYPALVNTDPAPPNDGSPKPPLCEFPLPVLDDVGKRSIKDDSFLNYSSQRVYSFDRRAMVVPPDIRRSGPNWEEAMTKFMTQQMFSNFDPLTFQRNFRQVPPGTESVGIGVPFLEEEVSLGQFALYGCTALVIISRKGVFQTHYWEVPTFSVQTPTRLKILWPNRTPTAKEIAAKERENFEKWVVKPLTVGAPRFPLGHPRAGEFSEFEHEPLSYYKNQGWFEPEQNARAYMVMATGNPDWQEKYGKKYHAIKEIVRKELGMQVKEVKYTPNEDQAKEEETAVGRLLVKYDNYENKGNRKPGQPKTRRIRAWSVYNQFHEDDWSVED